jgi:hypothetical protein
MRSSLKLLALLVVVLGVASSSPVFAADAESVTVTAEQTKMIEQFLTPMPEISEQILVASLNTSQSATGFAANVARVREILVRNNDFTAIAQDIAASAVATRTTTVQKLAAVQAVFEKFKDVFAAYSLAVGRNAPATELQSLQVALDKVRVSLRAASDDFKAASQRWEDAALLAKDEMHALTYGRVAMQVKINELQVAAARAEVLPLSLLHGTPAPVPAPNSTASPANPPKPASGGAVATQVLSS